MGNRGKLLDIEQRTLGVIKCPVCGVSSPLVEWDSLTHSKCTSREMRRAFISLEEARAYNRKDNKMMYMCPNCNEYINGSKLKVYVE